MRWGAVIAAAGHGTRFGRPKQFVEIAGMPMVGWSIRTLASMSEIVEVIVATEPDHISRTEELLAEIAPECSARVVAGGATRQESVRNGMLAFGSRVDAALVHDGARPLVHLQDVRAGMREVRGRRGAVLATPVVDTVKVVDPETLLVRRTLERSTLWAAQTPQFGMLADFAEAYALDEAATDDATLLERIGVEVVVVASRHANFKVTVPEDVSQAELLLRERIDAGVPESDTLLVEVFGAPAMVDPICREVEARGGRIDAIDRELPRGAVVRAYLRADRLRDFESSFGPLAEGTATLTVHEAGGVP